MQEIIGNFKVIKKLGEGGMGEVYKGVDTVLEREVAIKMLRPELSSQPGILERFRTEAVALARLNDPSIAMLYAFHQDSGQAYMVMEFVPGETLADVMKQEGKVPCKKTLKLISQVLSGLEHAHLKDIVHRDIKPSNIMLGQNGDPKLMDFGIARILERSRLTRTGYLIGTLQYMSPEQVQGLEADRRSDIYSIGIVLYEMLTGRIPFEKTTDYEIIKAQVEELPRPPSELLPGLDPLIERAILKALAKKPSDRFDTAAEFRQTLLHIYNQDAIKPEAFDPKIAPKTRIADVPFPKSGPFQLRARPGVVLTGLLFAAGLALVFWFSSDRDTSRDKGSPSLDSIPSNYTDDGNKTDPDKKELHTPEQDPTVSSLPEETKPPGQEDSRDSGSPGESNDQKDAGNRRPDFSDPNQQPEIDLNAIGIPLIIEEVKEVPPIASKTTRKTNSSTTSRRRITNRTHKTPAPDKKEDWTTKDFGESYE